MKKEKLLVAMLVAVFALLAFLSLASAETFSGKGKMVSEQKYDSFLSKMEARGFSLKELIGILADGRMFFDRNLIFGKGKRIDYFSEEFGLFKPESIARGKNLLAEKAGWLEEAEKRFGTEKQVMISIFRVETNFGSYLGSRHVLNSLHTLFLCNWRSWAEAELANFLVLCKKNNYDPWSIKGSTCGAFGLWQFMPSSFLDFAIDGNGDGKIDLFCFEDALFSAARYLKGKGWRNGQSIQETVTRKHVLWKYNNDVDYGRAIIAYGQAINGF